MAWPSFIHLLILCQYWYRVLKLDEVQLGMVKSEDLVFISLTIFRKDSKNSDAPIQAPDSSLYLTLLELILIQIWSKRHSLKRTQAWKYSSIQLRNPAAKLKSSRILNNTQKQASLHPHRSPWLVTDFSLMSWWQTWWEVTVSGSRMELSIGKPS